MLRKILFASLLTLTACGNSGDGKIASSSGNTPSCRTNAVADIGGSFSLINQDGIRITEEDLKGQPSVVFFGFTYCPDVCPFALNKIDTAIKALPEDRIIPRTVMISVDPERDTPEQLKTYISNEGFPDDIIGVTGTEAELKDITKKFLAGYNRQDDDSSEDGYTVNHTAMIYLMDKDWNFQTFFSPEANPRDMAVCMAQYLPKKP